MTVVFSDTLSFSEMDQILSKYSFIKPLQQEQKIWNVAIPDLDKDLSCEEIKKEINGLKYEEKILFVNLFLTKDNLSQLEGITNTFVVHLKDTADYPLLEEIANKFHSTISHKTLDEKTYILMATPFSPGDGLETSNKFYETGKFKFAEPNLIKLLNR